MEEKKNNSLFIIIIAVLAVICICIGIVLFMKRSDGDRKNDTVSVEEKNKTTNNESVTTQDEEKETIKQTDPLESQVTFSNEIPSPGYHLVNECREGYSCSPIDSYSHIEYATNSTDKKIVSVIVNDKAYEVYGFENKGRDFTISFDQDVVEIVSGGNGQESSQNSVFFLLQDGSVYGLNERCALQNTNFQMAKKYDEISNIVKLSYMRLTSTNPNVSHAFDRVFAQDGNGSLMELDFPMCK